MEKINVAKLLKDCPKGMELDCILFGAKVIYKGLSKRIPTHPIVVQTEHGFEFELTQYGQIHNIVGSNCVIFPKGKFTWEGFVPPCQFKDGDIIFTHANCLKVGVGNTWISIFKERRNGGVATYVDYAEDGSDYYSDLDGDKALLCMESDILRQRFATEEEKEKLFQVIKDNGYYWNSETKTLEKLIIPQFKVGNRIKEKQTGICGEIISVQKNRYDVKIDDKGLYVYFREQDNWELVPNKFDINSLIPFESKVLVRYTKNSKWCGSFFSFIDRDIHSHCYKFVTTANKSYPMMIPYKGNEYLLGKVEVCKDFYKTWEDEPVEI